jgi:hypothetical protein
MITLPGKAFFIPNEQPSLVADLIVQALAQAPVQPAANGSQPPKDRNSPLGS